MTTVATLEEAPAEGVQGVHGEQSSLRTLGTEPSGDWGRRVAACKQLAAKKLQWVQFSDKAPVLANQEYVLVGMSNVERSPQTAQPGVAVFGFFRTLEQLSKRVAQLKAAGFDWDYWWKRSGEWFIVSRRRPVTEEEVAAEQTRITERLRVYRAKRLKNFQEVERVSRDKTKSKTSYDKEQRAKRVQQRAQRRKQPSIPEEGEADGKKTEGAQDGQDENSIPLNLRYPKTNVFVASILQDSSRAVRLGKKKSEPLVRVYAGFRDEKSAEAWVQESLVPTVGEFDSDCFDMYEWVGLGTGQLNPDLQQKEVFREDEVTRIIRTQKEEKYRSAAVRLTCKNLGMPDPSIDVSKPRDVPEGAGEAIPTRLSDNQTADELRHAELLAARGQQLPDVSEMLDKLRSK
eukprot:gnl/Hemi2/23439_TR7857_c0_g1_i1.p2 gnl/Hemi2/23439_TR7857_c0_g1~~gnl/Hemi2/23439_TR7857_c0_g1_i1.p2  ORF type:complete len:414 (+),score=96.37 gnl/Hemi2/23439_TR7857_c0_g1_i1:37-1242(+)